MDGTVNGILTCPILEYTPKSQCPVPSYSPVGWTGLSMRFSRPILKYTSKSQCPVLQSCGMDGTVHWILTCPILKYTSKSQRPIPSYSPVGWTGLSMGFSNVPSSSIPPNPSVPSCPAVLWNGRDCPLDSHMSHPQVYLQIPASHPILRSCGMDGTVHGILTCPILKYTPKSQCPVLSCSPVEWTGLSTGFSHVPSSSIPPNPSVPSHPTVLWDGRDCPWDSHVPSSSIPPNPSVPSRPAVLWDGRDCPLDSHMSHPQVYLQIPASHPILRSCGMDGTVHGILTCPILKYTPKSQCPVLSCSPVEWTGLSTGFSHVPSSSIPPNPSVPSHPTVLWDGRDCPLDSHMSHPQVYLQIPASHPILQSCGMDGTVHGILTSHPQVYPQIPVSRPVLQSCGMDGTVHWILTCPTLKYTSKSQCPIPSYSPVGWTGLSMGFSRPILKYTPKSQCPVPSCSPVGWTGLSMGFSRPILKYTPKSQCPVPSCSPVGWLGLSMGFLSFSVSLMLCRLHM